MCNSNTINEPEGVDQNPVYATYEVHDDPIAEVEDSNAYYYLGDAYGENSVRTKIKDNNPEYE